MRGEVVVLSLPTVRASLRLAKGEGRSHVGQEAGRD